MQKPEYLSGNCLTFLDLMKWSIDEHQMPEFDRLVEVTKFYSQSFTKDMIVRPEKPNKKTNNLNAEIVVWEGWQPLFKGEWEFHGNSHGVLIFNKSDYSWSLWGRIDTTDDFIREAKKAGINLKWYDRKNS